MRSVFNVSSACKLVCFIKNDSENVQYKACSEIGKMEHKTSVGRIEGKRGRE